MISVCMATYNGEKYISEQISSILHQLGTDDELIITDDISSDGTIEIVRSFDDARLKLHINESRLGYSKNFEKAISLSKGDFIFLSDQDDVWLENRVYRMMLDLENNYLVVSNAEFVDSNLQPLGESVFNLRGGRAGFFWNIYKLQYIGICIAFRREMLGKLLPFPNRVDLCPHDMWIACVAELYFKTARISENLMLYRRHLSNVSSGGYKSKNSLIRMLSIRIYVCITVLTRFFK